MITPGRSARSSKLPTPIRPTRAPTEHISFSLKRPLAALLNREANHSPCEKKGEGTSAKSRVEIWISTVNSGITLHDRLFAKFVQNNMIHSTDTSNTIANDERDLCLLTLLVSLALNVALIIVSVTFLMKPADNGQ